MVTDKNRGETAVGLLGIDRIAWGGLFLFYGGRATEKEGNRLDFTLQHIRCFGGSFVENGFL